MRPERQIASLLLLLLLLLLFMPFQCSLPGRLGMSAAQVELSACA